jgi:hypothetical protein
VRKVVSQKADPTLSLTESSILMTLSPVLVDYLVGWVERN